MNKFMHILVFGLVTVLGLSGFTSCNDESSVESDIIENSIPIANDQNITVYYNTTKDFNITGSDEDNDTITFVIESNATHGAIVLSDETTGEVTYTPDQDYSGPDHFTFKVVDEFDASSSIADVNITVTGDCSNYTTKTTCNALNYCLWLVQICVPNSVN